MDAEAASQQLHAEHLHPMRSGAGARRSSVDGQRGLPPGDSEGSSLLAPPPAAAESDGRQRVPRRRAPHGSRGFIVRLGAPKKYVV